MLLVCNPSAHQLPETRLYSSSDWLHLSERRLGCVPEDDISHLQLKKYLLRYVQYVCVQTEKYNGPLKGLTMLQCEGARETIYFGHVSM